GSVRDWFVCLAGRVERLAARRGRARRPAGDPDAGRVAAIGGRRREDRRLSAHAPGPRAGRRGARRAGEWRRRGGQDVADAARAVADRGAQRAPVGGRGSRVRRLHGVRADRGAGWLEESGHRERLRSIWTGIVLALAASAVTAVALKTALAAIPASREIIEGLTLLLAVAVLFSVSYWLISRVEAARWQQFIREKVTSALEHGGGRALAFVAFPA